MDIIVAIIFLAVQLYFGALMVLCYRASTFYGHAADSCRDALWALNARNYGAYNIAIRKIEFWETRGCAASKVISRLTFGLLRAESKTSQAR